MTDIRKEINITKADNQSKFNNEAKRDERRV